MVVESKIEFGDDRCGPAVIVVGTVENLSPVNWKDFGFHVEFFAREGRLLGHGKTGASNLAVAGQAGKRFQDFFPSEISAGRKGGRNRAKRGRTSFLRPTGNQSKNEKTGDVPFFAFMMAIFSDRVD